MKKFTVSLMAVLMLLVCVLAIHAPQAQAAETTDPVLYHCLCGNKHSTALTDGEITWKEGTEACYDGCDGVILEWTEWSAASPKNAGNYYMISNHTGARGFTSAVEGTINVDMNGYNIQVTSGTARAINAGSGNTINYCNTKTTGGLITAKGMASREATVIKVYSTTTLNLYGVDVAAYDGGNSTTEGGAVMVDSNCTFTMNGGTITGAATSGVGGAIYSKSTLKLTNVDVVGAVAGGSGGAICAASGSFTMNGGSITGGSNAGYGGNLYVGANVPVNMTGVTVSGGSAKNGGNIYAPNEHFGDFKLTDCVIHSGTATGQGGNLWLGTAGVTTTTDAEGVETTSSSLATLTRTTIYGGEAGVGGSVLTTRRLNMVRSTIGYDLDGNQAGGVATDRGGNVFVNNAELVVQKESKIGYGSAVDGGNVYVTGTGKLSTYDWSVVQWGNASDEGGNVYLNSGELYFGGTAENTHQTGSQIVNGQAVTAGGNVYVKAGMANAQGDALIAGGGSKKTTMDGGNIYVCDGATFTMKGRAIVRAGTDLGDGQQAGNIYNAGTLEILGESKVYGGATVAKTGERNIYCASTGTVNMINHINSKDEYVVNEAVVRGGMMINGGKLVLEGSPWIKSNLVGNRSLYLYNNTVVDATGLIEGADVEIFDTAASGEGRKIADVTGEQTWIKDAFRLSEDSTLAYVISREIDAEGNVSLWLRPAIAASVETETGVYDYQTTDEAIANCDASETIILDLKGQAVTLDIPGNLKLIDSANDDYTTQTGTFTGTVSGEIYNQVDANGNHYLVVENEGVYSAHRYDVVLTHVSLDAANDALGYKAEFFGDDVAKSQVVSIGFNLWVNENNVITRAVNGQTAATLRLKNILANNGGEMVINGNAFVTFQTADPATSADYSTTMKAAVEAVETALEADPAAYSAQQIQAVQGLLSRFENAVQDWNIDTILAWTDPEATV